MQARPERFRTKTQHGENRLYLRGFLLLPRITVHDGEAKRKPNRHQN
jgi:hypothetical protein